MRKDGNYRAGGADSCEKITKGKSQYVELMKDRMELIPKAYRAFLTHRDKKKVMMAEESSLLMQYGKISATHLCVAAFSTLSLSFPITLTIFTTPQPKIPHSLLSFPQFDP